VLLCCRLLNSATRQYGKTTTLQSNIMDLKQYWKENLRYLVILLIVWFVVSYGLGILFVEQMNTIKIGGFKLGFWFAQQGSIYVFVALIFIYVYLMNKLDKKYGVDE
jgi:putative solute:sodium symporter small subunit